MMDCYIILNLSLQEDCHVTSPYNILLTYMQEIALYIS